jgi:hypothetical protein
MNAPHLPHYPVHGSTFGTRWYEPEVLAAGDMREELGMEHQDEWLEEHPVSTLLVAGVASIMGGAAWTVFFLWFFHEWHQVLIIVPLVLAAVAFGLFRWLYHRIN